MNLLLVIFLLFINVQSLRGNSTSPTSSPSSTAPSNAPTSLPTFGPNFITKFCPVQTDGVAQGNILFNGSSYLPISAVYPVIVNDNFIIFSSSGNNDLEIRTGTLAGMNITLNPSIILLEDFPFFDYLTAQQYSSTEILFGSLGSNNLYQFQLLDLTTGLLGFPLATNINDFGSFIPVVLSNIKVGKIIVAEKAKEGFQFKSLLVASMDLMFENVSIPDNLGPISSLILTQDNGMLFMISAINATFEIYSYDTNQKSNFIMNNVIPYPEGQASLNFELKFFFPAEYKGMFYLIYTDPYNIYVITSSDGFKTYQNQLVGTMPFSITSVNVWLQNEGVTITVVHNSQLYAIPWIPKNSSISFPPPAFNNTYGQWMSEPVLVFESLMANSDRLLTAYVKTMSTSFMALDVVSNSPEYPNGVVSAYVCQVTSAAKTTVLQREFIAFLGVTLLCFVIFF